ncbi:MAG TPA: hypothetical protein VFQ12_00440 [Thermoleophilaceae bacterium]|nr:hypothetical protein [Thermoleophilaceae bacterium]
MAERVDTAVEPVKPAAVEPPADPVVGKTECEQLPSGHHAVLAPCKLRGGSPDPRVWAEFPAT